MKHVFKILILLAFVIFGIVLYSLPRDRDEVLNDSGSSKPLGDRLSLARKLVIDPDEAYLNYADLVFLDRSAVERLLLREAEEWGKSQVFDSKALKILCATERFSPDSLPKVIQSFLEPNEDLWRAFLINNTSGKFTLKCLAISDSLQRQEGEVGVNSVKSMLLLIKGLDEHDSKIWKQIEELPDMLSQISLTEAYLKKMYEDLGVEDSFLLDLTTQSNLGVHLLAELVSDADSSKAVSLYQKIENPHHKRLFVEGMTKSLKFDDFKATFEDLEKEDKGFGVFLYSEKLENFDNTEMWKTISLLEPGRDQSGVAKNVRAYFEKSPDFDLFKDNQVLPLYLESLPKNEYDSVVVSILDAISKQGKDRDEILLDD